MQPAICTSRELPECYRIVGNGLGAGKRDYKRPGLLRALLLETEEPVYESDSILKLECNIDDCTGKHWAMLWSFYWKMAQEMSIIYRSI